MITTFEQFYENFKKYPKISYNEFIKECIYEDKEKLYDFILKQSDIRTENIDTFFENVYKMTITNRKETLKDWFNNHLKIKSLDDFLFFGKGKNKNVLFKNSLIDGNFRSNLSRFYKNLHWKEIYNTDKIFHWTTFKLLTEWFNNFNFHNTIIAPNSFKKFVNYNSSDLWAIIRGVSNKASIFNPYTFYWILENLLKGEKLLTLTMGWNSYFVAFLNSNYKEYVGIDVIPELKNNCDNIFNHYYKQQKKINKFIKNVPKTNKNYQVYICPSEQIEQKENFSKHYSDYFDTVLFSPPYYDLEKYNNGEQSIKSFKTYEEWLQGYWKPTVELCFNSLKKGGKFAYVISDYKDKKIITISEDTRKIVESYFGINEWYGLTWKNFKNLNEKNIRKDNVENLFIFTK